MGLIRDKVLNIANAMTDRELADKLNITRMGAIKKKRSGYYTLQDIEILLVDSKIVFLK